MKRMLIRALFYCLLIAAVTLVSAIAFELSSRVYLWQVQPGLQRLVIQHQNALLRGLSGRRLFVPHPYLSYAPADVAVDASGCVIAGIRFSAAKPNGAIRVACLGGSTTKNTYPRYLKPLLESVFPGKTIEVMDWGCQGWTMVESALNFVIRARAFQPDIVIIHHGINDIAPRVRATPKLDYSHYRHAFEPKALNGLDSLSSFSQAAAWIQLLAGSRHSDLDEATVLPAPPGGLLDLGAMPDEESLKPYANALDTICRLSIADQGKPIIAGMVYAVTGFIDERLAQIVDEHNRVSRNAAKQFGIPYAPLLDAISDFPDQFMDQCHLTEYGDRIKAQMLASAIAESFQVPPPLSIQPARASTGGPALRFEWNLPAIPLSEIHFWAQIDGKPRVFLGRIIAPKRNWIVWEPGAVEFAEAFRSGPAAGRRYLISAWPIDSNGAMHPPYYPARPIRVEDE